MDTEAEPVSDSLCPSPLIIMDSYNSLGWIVGQGGALELLLQMIDEYRRGTQVYVDKHGPYLFFGIKFQEPLCLSNDKC